VVLRGDHSLPIETPTSDGQGPIVVAGGDAVTGAALVVTAIADGRRAALECDRRLRARTLGEPAPIPADRAAWDALQRGGGVTELMER
jgi:hypothetical protein